MKNKNKTRGQVMALAGFFMILVNVLTFLLRDDTQFVVGTLGLLFLIIGINLSKKK